GPYSLSRSPWHARVDRDLRVRRARQTTHSDVDRVCRRAGTDLAQLRRWSAGRRCWWRIRIRAADTGETYSRSWIPPNPRRRTGFTHTLRIGKPANVEHSAGFERHVQPPGHRSRRYRCLIQPTPVHLAAIRINIRTYAARAGARVWRASSQPGMRAETVVVALEIEELHLQIAGRPEQGAVQAFAPDGADQPFNKWMRERHVRDGLHF